MTGKNFYLRLTVEKMHAFTVFNNFDLRPCSCSDRAYTATVNCANPKTETLSEMIEIKIIGIQIVFLFFC